MNEIRSDLEEDIRKGHTLSPVQFCPLSFPIPKTLGSRRCKVDKVTRWKETKTEKIDVFPLPETWKYEDILYIGWLAYIPSIEVKMY